MVPYKVISKVLAKKKSFRLDCLLLLTVRRDSFVILHVQMGFCEENGICPSLCSSLSMITLKTIFLLKMARVSTDKRNSRPENN